MLRLACVGVALFVTASVAWGQLVVGGAPATRPVDQQTRIYELIYRLRNSVLLGNSSETYAAVRELARIGKPAVPALCAELDRSSNDAPLRVIPFTLRVIGDPRAVPALVRALPRTILVSSDCGDRIEDAEVWKFISERSLSGRNGVGQYPRFNIPRADREIIYALKMLTNHSVSEAVSYVGRSDAKAADTQALIDARQKDADAWDAWWKEHGKELVSAGDLAAMNRPADPGDPVGDAGRARYGANFPAGAAVRLGPVHDLVLAPQDLWDNAAFLDFDTGHAYGLFERTTPQKDDPMAWFNEAGIDAMSMTYVHRDKKDDDPERLYVNVEGRDIVAWSVADARWDSLEQEVKKGPEVDPGPFGPASRFERIDPVTKEADNYPEKGTFLFITREGGRGILQLLGPSNNPPGAHLRFRMFEGIAPAKGPALPDPIDFGRGIVFSPEIKISLPSPASETPVALNLSTGKTIALPAPATHLEHEQWAADNGADVIPQPENPGNKLVSLTAYQMRIAPVHDSAWDYAHAGADDGSCLARAAG